MRWIKRTRVDECVARSHDPLHHCSLSVDRTRSTTCRSTCSTSPSGPTTSSCRRTRTTRSWATVRPHTRSDGPLCATPSLTLSLCVYQRAVMGKAEGYGEDWHGHVTAVTVAPEFRRLGLAKKLMDSLENVSEHLYVSLSLAIVRAIDSHCVPQVRRLLCRPLCARVERTGHRHVREARVLGLPPRLGLLLERLGRRGRLRYVPPSLYLS